MLLAKGQGPDILEGFGNRTLPAIGIIIEATPVSTARQDLLSLVPVKPLPGERINIHMLYGQHIVWQFWTGGLQREAWIPFDQAWLGVKAKWIFSGDANHLAVYRNNQKIGENKTTGGPFTPQTGDLHISGDAGFQGEIGNWSIHDTLQTPGNLWPWVIGIGLTVGLITLSRKKGRLSFA